MASRYERHVTAGAVRYVRSWEAEPGRLPTLGGGGTNAGQAGLSTAGRVSKTFSARSRKEMHFWCSGLPWELLGRHAAMVTLTYPGDWRKVVPDARTAVEHRKRLYERWRRRYGTPMGLWVVEFQERGAPHTHLYVGLPESACSEGEYAGYVRRRLLRKDLEAEHGKREGRRQVPAVQGEFAEWLLHTWWEIVGSGDRRHRYRGVDVEPVFWSEKSRETVNMAQVAEYFWRESGKWAQKQPPPDFGSLRFWGVWGQKAGFTLRVEKEETPAHLVMEERRLMMRKVEGDVREQARRTGKRGKKYRGPRGRDGLTVYVADGPAFAGRLRRWSEDVVEWKQETGVASEPSRRRRRRPERELAVRYVDPDTGEVIWE